MNDNQALPITAVALRLINAPDRPSRALGEVFSAAPDLLPTEAAAWARRVMSAAGWDQDTPDFWPPAAEAFPWAVPVLWRRHDVSGLLGFARLNHGHEVRPWMVLSWPGILARDQVAELHWRRSVDGRYWVGRDGLGGPCYVAETDPAAWLAKVKRGEEESDENGK